VSGETWADVRPHALLHQVPASEYHRDAWGRINGMPTLSRSIAAELITCPRKAWAFHPLLGGQDRPEESESKSANKERGTLLHQYFLGGDKSVAVIVADDFKTKKAKAERDEARDAGLIPLLEKKRDELAATCEGVRASLALGDPENGVEPIDLSQYDTEVTALWFEEVPEGQVPCRARLDAIRRDAQEILDFKFTYSAEPGGFARSMVPCGYDIQHAAYVSAVEHCFPRLAGRVPLRFLAIEPVPPYCWHVQQVAGSMATLGRQRWTRSCRTWKRCLDSGKWPMYHAQAAEAWDRDLEREMYLTVNLFGEAPPTRPDPSWF
jgi:hypothetical protein